MDANRYARIALSMVAEPGDPTIVRMIHERGAVATWVIISDRTAENEYQARIPLPSRIEKLIRDMHQLEVGTVIPGDIFWPTEQLARLGDAEPIILYTRGNTGLLTEQKKVAIVGARAATGYGEHVTMEMSAGMVDRGYTIVSGAAYGIDGMAHRSALASRGNTIAVLAGGLDHYYPAGNKDLLNRIAEDGLVVSELPIGSTPTRWRFLQRNRIIAALSDALLVVEAGYRSGSLNAARHAVEANVPLGAVPGPVTSVASAGCHRLINEGAALITNADEFAELAHPTV